MIGLSGARIRLAAVKTGPGCREQGEYVEHLGPEVAPRMLGIVHDGYAMEQLREAPCTRSTLEAAVHQLRTRVWNRPPWPRYHEPLGWQQQLSSWCELHAPWITTIIRRVYDVTELTSPRWCLTHGDPTLSNVMLRDPSLEERRGHEAGVVMPVRVLADPIPPHGKVPPLPEVDRGKLLQSVIGWERVLFYTLGIDRTVRLSGSDSIDVVLEGCTQNERQQAWFWAAVHCARLVPYAKRAGHTALAEWGARKSREICSARGVTLLED